MTFFSFAPNCTTPLESVSWVVSAPLRSSLDIIWTCLLTIVACTYTVLHLDIIADDEGTLSRKSKWWTDTCRTLRDLAVEVAVAIVAVVAPDFINANSIQQYLMVKTRSCKTLIASLHEHGPQWIARQAYYAKMGGYRLCIETPYPLEDGRKAYDEFMLVERAFHVIMSRVIGPIELPLTDKEVGDYSTTSSFSKTVATLQIVWFAVSVISRLARQLSVSLLEVGTVSFAVLALSTWTYCFQKPKGVKAGMRLYLQLPDDIRMTVGIGSEVSFYQPVGAPIRSQRRTVKTFEEGSPADSPGVPGLFRLHGNTLHVVPTESGSLVDDAELAKLLTNLKQPQRARSSSLITEVYAQLFSPLDVNHLRQHRDVLYSIAFSAILPGIVHIAAWNASFPTTVDRWLWRGSAIATTLPAVLFLVVWLLWTISKAVYGAVFRTDGWSALDGTAARRVTLTIYGAARLIILVEMVRCLLYLPPEAYVPTWAADLPHLG